MSCDALKTRMPILKWLPTYNIRQNLKSDVIAAVTVAVMLIPQEMSLSALMGVPLQNGFYTAAVAPMVYPWFGSSSSASIANTAEGCLLVSVMLSSLGGQCTDLHDVMGSPERAEYAAVLAFFTGVCLILGGLGHAGQLINYFSRTSMNGYVNATCVMIILSQIAPWLGISLRHANASSGSNQLTILTLVEIVANVHQANGFSCCLGIFCMGLLMASKSVKKYLQSRLTMVTNASAMVSDDPIMLGRPENDRLVANEGDIMQALPADQDQMAEIHKAPPQPNTKNTLLMTGCLFLCDASSLVVCLVGIWVGSILDKDRIDVIGHVEPGLPRLKLPGSTLSGQPFANVVVQLVTDAMVLALVFFMSTVAISRKLARVRGDQILPNQEFLGLGFANLFVALFQGTPSAAGLSRSAVNAQHAQTPLASILTSLIVMLVLMFCTQLLYFLPKAPLCAIIITAAGSILDVSEWTRLRRIKKTQEAFVWLASFAGTLLLGLLRGLAFSIACSVVLLGFQSANPRVAVLGTVVDESSGDPIEMIKKRLNAGASSSQPYDVKSWTFVEMDNTPQAKEIAELLVIRVYQSLYFGNCALILERIERLLDQKQNTTRVLGVVIDASRVNDIDATSLVLLHEFESKLHTSRDQMLTFANTTLAIHESLVASEFQVSSPLEFTQSIACAVEGVYRAKW